MQNQRTISSSAPVQTPPFVPSREMRDYGTVGVPEQSFANEFCRRAGDNPCRVLIVDDEKITRMRLGRILSTNGYEFQEATTGREALAHVHIGEFDLVVMDISMPVMDGFWTLRMMRQLYDSGQLPIVMMTASDDREQVLKSFDRGANDYIAKPIDPAVAMARIKNQMLVKESQRELRASEQRYALTARGSNDGMWDWDLINGDLYLSPRFREMVGMADCDWSPLGSDWMELIHDEDRLRVNRDLDQHLRGDSDHFETEMRMRDNESGHRWMLCRGLAVREKDGRPTRIAGSLTDITEGKVADTLTGLPNRTLFRERVKRCIEQCQDGTTQQFAVMYMDVDDFKLVNDSYGHDAGDEFLKQIAQRLGATLRDSEAVVARLGGDEFGILVENIKDKATAIHIAERLQAKMAVPFQIADRELNFGGSLGIAFGQSTIDGSSITPEELLRQADMAMYDAKRSPDRNLSVYENQMLLESSLRTELSLDLQDVIERDQLELHYQPVVCLRNGNVIGFEALLRWKHPVHGFVPPSTFVPLAESNGLIVEIGKWVLQRACRDASDWQTGSTQGLGVSVNVSVVQLGSREIVDTIKASLDDANLPPELLLLEVTESLLMRDPEDAIEPLSEIKDLGVKIGMDDFGTGYSSLSYLHQMPLSILKIDRSFVARVTDSTKHEAIVRSIVALAQSLNLRVVAEGVETLDQLAKLKELGCQNVQGYLLGYPKPVKTAIEESKTIDAIQLMACNL